MRRTLSFLCALLMFCALPFALLSCGDDGGDVVVFEIQDHGDIEITLRPDVAPKTVENFKKLVSEGFYDGLIFHRIVRGFVIQGGDPEGTGYGGSEETIEGEFSANGYENDLSHTRGVVSMARSSSYNSASSQFFICLSDDYTRSLDGLYAAFGVVTDGMDVVDEIAAVPTDRNDKPLTDVVITRAYIKE